MDEREEQTPLKGFMMSIMRQGFPLLILLGCASPDAAPGSDAELSLPEPYSHHGKGYLSFTHHMDDPFNLEAELDGTGDIGTAVRTSCDHDDFKVSTIMIRLEDGAEISNVHLTYPEGDWSMTADGEYLEGQIDQFNIKQQGTQVLGSINGFYSSNGLMVMSFVMGLDLKVGELCSCGVCD